MIVVLGKGTRGDVLPLLVAIKLLLDKGDACVHLITHEAHRSLAAKLLARHPKQLAFWGLSSLPIGADLLSNDFDEIVSILVSILPQQRLTVVGNLFSLECCLLAAFLGVRLVIIHPCLPQCNGDIKRAVQLAAESELVDWAWPLLTDTFDPFWDLLEQQLAKHKSSCSLRDTIANATVIITASPFWISSPSDGCRWQLTGLPCDRSHDFLCQDAAQCVSDHAVVDQFIGLSDRPVVCVDMGSMTAQLADLPARWPFLQAVLGLAPAHRLIIICHGVQSAYSLLTKWTQGCRDVLIMSADLNHHLMLASCAVLIHHGGAGTVQTALLAGCSQVVAPLMYDQHAHRRAVDQLGVGSSIDSIDRVCSAGTISSVLHTAVKVALQPLVRQRALDIASKLSSDPAENGMDNLQRIVVDLFR